MGTGTGILPILLAAKTEGESFTGLEIQEKSAEMAGRSVAYNHLEGRVRIVAGDIKEAGAIFGPASFDVVVSNPPYMTGSHGLVNPNEAKAVARHEVLCTLEDLVRETAAVLTSRGRFYLVHRPFRLAEIMGMLMKYRLEPKRMRLVYPYVDKEPNMVLLEACKGGNPRIQVERPLIVYERPNVYTDRSGKSTETGADSPGKGRSDGRKTISVRHADWESGRYHFPGGEDVKGSRFDSGGGYPEQHQAAEPF